MNIPYNSIKEAIDYLGKEYFAHLNVQYQQVSQADSLTIIKNGNNVTIKFGELSSLFRALTIIKIKANQENYDVCFDKHFSHCGLMHDCSRNGVLSVKSAKKYILLSALFGLNRFLLYTEDVYELNDEPYFGYLRGRYTKDELKEIAQYGDSFGVEVVPCIQTLSHLNQALRWDAYASARESGQTLLVGSEKAYELIDKMIKTCSEVFTSKNIHIGMDEAFDLGAYRFALYNQVIDKTKDFLTHLNKVVKICEKYHLHPMMWGDMFFQLNAKGPSWYEETSLFSDEVKSLIPDIDLIYWDYYHDDKAFYDTKFKALLDTKKETIFAGGAISWIGFAPNIYKSLDISRAGLESSIKNGVKNVFVTSWGDNGDECSIWSSLPSLALYSTYAYEGKCDNKTLSNLLEAITGDSLKMWGNLELPNKLREDLLPYENPSKPFLYQDPLNGFYDSKVKDNYSSLYRKHGQTLKADAKLSKNFGYVFKTLSDLCFLLEYKVDIGVKLRKAYQEHNLDALGGCLIKLSKIIKRLDVFTKSFKDQWLLENKPQGLDVIDGRLGYLRNRIITTYNFVKDYLDKKIESIPELEEKIIAETDNDNPITNANNWAMIASVNAI